MNRWKSPKTPLVVGAVLAILQFAASASDAVAGALPKEPCALLKSADIQALAPDAKIDKGVADTSMVPLGIGCTYTWGPKTSEGGESTLTITVIDVPTAWPGTSAEVIKQGMAAKVTAGGPDASEVPGVGDAAAFYVEARSHNAIAEGHFHAKGFHVTVKLHSGDASSSKDKLIALMKDGASKL